MMMRTNWMHDEPCPRCDCMTLATNGTGSRWCINRECGYTILITRRRLAEDLDPDRAQEEEG